MVNSSTPILVHTGKEIDDHFVFPVYQYVEEVNDPTIDNGHYESLLDFGVALGHDREFLRNYHGAIYTRLCIAYWDRATRGASRPCALWPSVPARSRWRGSS